MSTLQFGPIANSEELAALGSLIQSCFLSSNWPRYVDRIGQENLFRIYQADQLVAGLGIYRVGQWFGGQRLPSAAIASVAVAPEVRGQGVAAHLMSQILHHLYESGTPIASLYASTQRLYRKVGFEPAGHNCHYSVDVTSLAILDRDLPLHQCQPQPDSSLNSLYTQWASAQTGLLDRTPGLWARRCLSESDLQLETYVAGDLQSPEGYILYGRPEIHAMAIRDLVAVTAAAARRIWTFIADHRSLVKQASWYGPIIDPYLSLLPEQTFRVLQLERWLLRIVNVSQALQLRGYPAHLEIELHLQVQDPLIPANTSPLILSVANGRGEVISGGRGDLQISVGGLAPLFSGLLTPAQLQVLGFLEAPPQTLVTATQIFAGPEPWMIDRF